MPEIGQQSSKISDGELYIQFFPIWANPPGNEAMLFRFGELASVFSNQ
jgi:hypothetical protein